MLHYFLSPHKITQFHTLYTYTCVYQTAGAITLQNQNQLGFTIRNSVGFPPLNQNYPSFRHITAASKTPPSFLPHFGVGFLTLFSFLCFPKQPAAVSNPKPPWSQHQKHPEVHIAKRDKHQGKQRCAGGTQMLSLNSATLHWFGKKK